MTVPAVPSPTCQISWIENGRLVTDGQPAVAVGFMYSRLQTSEVVPTLAPMVSLCQSHLTEFSPRQYSVCSWSFLPIGQVAVGTRNPNIEAPPKRDPATKPTFINPGAAL